MLESPTLKIPKNGHTMNDEQFDALFTGGSPARKFFDVLRTANGGVVEQELEKLLLEYAAMEMQLENHPEFEVMLKNAAYGSDEKLNGRLESIYIRVTADIVSKE